MGAGDFEATPLLGSACLFWFGFVSSISFMEAPVKFKAPSLTKEVALDVGRTVFAALNKVEMCFSVATFVLMLLGSRNKSLPGGVPLWTLLGTVWATVLVQRVVLQPILQQRALQIIKRDPFAKPTALSKYTHILYIISDVLKVSMLGIAGYRLVIAKQ